MAQTIGILRNQKVSKRRKSFPALSLPLHFSYSAKSLKLLLGIALISGAAIGLYALVEGLAQAAFFKLQAISVCFSADCHRDAAREQQLHIRDLFSSYSEENIYLIPRKDISDTIAALPGVQSASLRTVFPNSLLVQIEEQKPEAITLSSGTLLLVNKDGNAIRQASKDDTRDLPLLSGCPEDHRQECLRAQILYLQNFQSSKPEVQIAELQYTKDVYRAYLMARPYTVLLSKELAPEELYHLSAIQPQVAALAPAVLELDLTVPGKVIAKLSRQIQ